jgi:hypothetical protein
MKTKPWSSSANPAAGWNEILIPEGFIPAAGGYESDLLRVQPGSDWWTFRQRPDELDPAAPQPSELPNTVGQAGPWKSVTEENAQVPVLALPASIFTDEPDETSGEMSEPVPLATAVLRWVQQTARGDTATDWQTPPLEVVQSWFHRDQLTVVVGALLRQGEVIHESNRLALRFPILPQLPDDLPHARRAWLHTLLEEAQNRWHLVRCGFFLDPESNATAAIAEVDLTGAPLAACETLFVTALEALRWAVQWLGEPADWLADANVASELLAVCPNQEPTKGNL